MNQKILRSEPSLRLPRCLARGIMMMMACLSLSLAHAQTTVSGKVTDETGTAMPGVNIVAKGTSIGTTTDSNGDYTINVPGGTQTLVFSFIGYSTKEEIIGNRTTIDLSMNLDAEQLAEVVVIGYGEQRKEAVTGSVASLSGESLREIPAANITQALQGRLPGVELTSFSSRPGETMQIRIRGERSLTASNDPLVVLDGIPFAGSISDIDPNSIKSVDILKDASATAIYGSRGANGVILVTTNRGVAGQPAQVSYNSFIGVKSVFAKYPMMDGPEFIRMREVAEQTQIAFPTGLYYGPSAEEDPNVSTDWQDLLYRNARTMSHDISVTKGTDNGNYSVGVGYFQDQSVLPTNQYTRFAMRAAIDQGIGKFFRFGLTSNSSYGFTEGNQVGIGIIGASPLLSPFDANGDLKRGVATSIQNDQYRVWTKESVEDASEVWLNESKTYGTYNNIYGEIEAPWVEGLKYRLQLGLNYRTTQGGAFTGRGVTSATDPNAPSTASQSNSRTTSWVVQNMLTYDKTIGMHKINVLGLYEAQEQDYNFSNTAVTDLPSDKFQYYNLGLAEGEITINSDANTWGLSSWMGRVMYSYNNRYMLSATLRSDGSSRLAPGHKWHTYPAVSAGWNIADEAFMSGIEVLDQLKLRVGYGETSNQAVDPYSTLGRLSTRFYNFGEGENGYSTGYILSELPNENLGWEFTETVNIGFDFSLFKGRLTGTLEYYKQHTKDILLQVNLPPTAGVPSTYQNIGETENKGVELALNGILIDNPDGFTWEAGINIYANRNELLALTSGQDRNIANSWFVGHPINVIYDHKRIGLWQENDPYRDILEPGGNPGMIKVEYTGDFNPDGSPVRAINADDRQVLDFNPNFQGGFNTRLAYKGFDFTIIGAFKSGGTLISTLFGRTTQLNRLSGRTNNVSVDYWTPENTGAKYPRPGGVSVSDLPKYNNTLAYFDASYLKVRTITLGYNFQGGWMQNAGIQRLRVYITAQNPFVMFSEYNKETGLDPEPNSAGNQNQGITTDFNSRLPIVGTNVPSTRNYLIGLNFTF